MKKVLSLVCLLAIVASCLFVFASCGGATPNSDIAKAEEALKAAGYTVNKAGNRLTANKDQDRVVIDYCDTEAAAQAIYDGYKAAEDAQKQLADAMGVDYESEGAYGMSGTMVWVGTDAAIKAAQ